MKGTEISIFFYHLSTTFFIISLCPFISQPVLKIVTIYTITVVCLQRAGDV